MATSEDYILPAIPPAPVFDSSALPPVPSKPAYSPPPATKPYASMDAAAYNASKPAFAPYIDSVSQDLKFVGDHQRSVNAWNAGKNLEAQKDWDMYESNRRALQSKLADPNTSGYDRMMNDFALVQNLGGIPYFDHDTQTFRYRRPKTWGESIVGGLQNGLRLFYSGYSGNPLWKRTQDYADAEMQHDLTRDRYNMALKARNGELLPVVMPSDSQAALDAYNDLNKAYINDQANVRAAEINYNTAAQEAALQDYYNAVGANRNILSNKASADYESELQNHYDAIKAERNFQYDKARSGFDKKLNQKDAIKALSLARDQFESGDLAGFLKTFPSVAASFDAFGFPEGKADIDLYNSLKPLYEHFSNQRLASRRNFAPRGSSPSYTEKTGLAFQNLDALLSGLGFSDDSTKAPLYDFIFNYASTHGGIDNEAAIKEAVDILVYNLTNTDFQHDIFTHLTDSLSASNPSQLQAFNDLGQDKGIASYRDVLSRAIFKSYLRHMSGSSGPQPQSRPAQLSQPAASLPKSKGWFSRLASSAVHDLSDASHEFYDSAFGEEAKNRHNARVFNSRFVAPGRDKSIIVAPPDSDLYSAYNNAI